MIRRIERWASFAILTAATTAWGAAAPATRPAKTTAIETAPAKSMVGTPAGYADESAAAEEAAAVAEATASAQAAEGRLVDAGTSRSAGLTAAHPAAPIPQSSAKPDLADGNLLGDNLGSSSGAKPGLINTPGNAALSPSANPGAIAAKPILLTRYERDILAFEAADRKSPPAAGGVVFYGSSSIRRWATLADDFGGLNVINRGFGGSTAVEAVHYAQRVVLPLKPASIIFYEGDNDLGIGRTPEQIVSDYQDFVRLVRDELPQTQIYMLAVKPSPKRLTLMQSQRELNTMLQSWITQSGDSNLHFVDVFSAMLDAKGNPRGDLFGPDRLHMNDDGYRIWVQLLSLKPIESARSVVKKTVNVIAKTVPSESSKK